MKEDRSIMQENSVIKYGSTYKILVIVQQKCYEMLKGALTLKCFKKQIVFTSEVWLKHFNARMLKG